MRSGRARVNQRNGSSLRRPPEPRRSVLSNRGFLLLWLAQLGSQTAQNAVLYGLLVLVTSLTRASTFTSILVLSFVIPTFLSGIFSGAIVDLWDKRRLLIITNILRAAATVLFLLGREHVWALIGITLLFSTFSQFFATANTVSIPFLVPRDQLISANSMFSAGVTASQFAGMILLAPILLPSIGARGLFIFCIVLFLLASVLARFLPHVESPGGASRRLPDAGELRDAVLDFWKALRTLGRDHVSSLAMVHVTVSSSLVLMFAVLVPRYMQVVLQVPADRAVNVFAPVGVGAVLGLRALPLLVNRLGKSRTVAIGLAGLAICLVAFASVQVIADLLKQTETLDPFAGEWQRRAGGLSILVALTGLFAGPLGFTHAMVYAPAQTVLHERAAAEMRGRIFAAQVVLANGVSVLPLMLAGGVADLYGVTPVILALALLVGAVAVATVMVERRMGPLEERGTGIHAADGGQ